MSSAMKLVLGLPKSGSRKKFGRRKSYPEETPKQKECRLYFEGLRVEDQRRDQELFGINQTVNAIRKQYEDTAAKYMQNAARVARLCGVDPVYLDFSLSCDAIFDRCLGGEDASSRLELHSPELAAGLAHADAVLQGLQAYFKRTDAMEAKEVDASE
jgi:hypothetical protein